MTSDIAPARENALLAYYDQFARAADKFRSPFLLFIRIYIGYQCIISGWGHLHHLDSMTEFFTKLHIPLPKLSVIISANTEVFGGALLLVGFASRLITLILTANFLVALFTVEFMQYNFSFSDLGQQIWKDQTPILGDTAFPFLATALIVLFFGPGCLSIDGIVKHMRAKR